MTGSLRERLLAEAFEERERIIDMVREQLAEVDAVIASLNGVVPLEGIPLQEPPPEPEPVERAAQRAAEEKPPTLAQEAQPPRRAAPGSRDQEVLAYLEEHGPSLRKDIVAGLHVQGNTAVRIFKRLVDSGQMIQVEGPPARGGTRHAVMHLPGQDPSEIQQRDVLGEERAQDQGHKTGLERGAETASARADERDQRIIAYISENGPTLRIGLTKALGIPRGSWGTLQPRLIQKGLIAFEVPSASSRPAVGFMLRGQVLPMGATRIGGGGEVITRQGTEEELRPQPPRPRSEEPERTYTRKDGEERKVPDMGGPDRFPEMLRYMPSAEKNMPTKSLRAVLEFERKVLMSLAEGPKLAVEVADELGDRSVNSHRARVSSYLNNADDSGHARRSGEGYPPWADGGGANKGRSSIEFTITDKGRAALRGEPWDGTESTETEESEGKEEETGPGMTDLPPPSTPTTTPDPSSEPPSSPTEPPRQEPSDFEPSDALSGPKLDALKKIKVPSYQDVRDAWTMFPGMMMSPGQLIKELGCNWPIAVVGAFMEQGVTEGKLTDKSPPGGEIRIFQYDRPEGPGKAAKIDMTRPAQSAQAASEPVAGTGKQPVPSHADAAALVRDVRKAGGTAEPVGSGHWKVVNPETSQSVRISGTPGNPRTVKNDRKRVKRNTGLNV